MKNRWDMDEAPGRSPGLPRDSGAFRPPRFLRAALTAAMLGTVLARAVRIGRHPESVAGWYSGPAGPLWALIYAVMFLGPFAAALAAASAPWVRGKAADVLWAAAFCGGGFFTLSEGLILFARSMDGRHAYVGAEPLLSLLVCAVSGLALLARRRANFRNPGSEPGGDRHD